MGNRTIDDAFSCQGALADTHDHSAPRNSRREGGLLCGCFRTERAQAQ